MMKPPRSHLLLEAGGIRVFHRPGRTGWTLVAFGPRQARRADDRWWGATLGRREELDVIGVAATAHDWYPRDVMAELLPAIRAAAKPAILAYGYGMGGYAALKYASALGARGVLALSPQYLIDPADRTVGARGMSHFDPVRHRDMRIMPGDYPDGAMLLWDPKVRSDNRHARAIARLPGIRPVRLRLAGHAMPAMFPETGRLVPVAEALLAGRPDDAVAGIRAARREAPSVLRAAASVLDAHGHPLWAAEARRRADGRPVDDGPALEARARAYARLGNEAGEIAALRAWLAATPGDAGPRLRLVERLMALGRPAEAEDAARHAIAAGFADERMRDALREAAAAARLARPQPAIEAAPAAERPEPRLLGETASIRLWHWPGEGPGTLVVFTPPSRKRSGPEEWWARGLSARLGWSTIVLAAHAPHWYPAADMARLLPLALEAMPAGPRITYGLGMGGYGALKHGRALAADATLALSPAWSIDPADMPGDPRAERVFHAKRNAGMAVRPGDLGLLPIIAFDPLLERDAAQARHLAAMPLVRAVPVPRGGHVLVNVLVETGRLDTLLAAALGGDGPGAVSILREARRTSPTLRGSVAKALDARGRGNWATALRLPLAAPSASETVRQLVVRARALHVQRRHDAEADVMRKWIEAEPDAMQPRLHLSQCLQLLGRHEDAAAVLFEAMAAGLRDDRLHAALVHVLRRLGRTAGAIARADAALATPPGDADALALRGEISLWAERTAEAKDAFQQALQQQPGHRPALLGLAAIEPEPPDGSAGPRLTALIDAFTAEAAPELEWLRAVDRFWHAGRSNEAIRLTAAALRLHPGATTLGAWHGRILLATGQQDAAVACFQELVRAAPEEAQAWHGLADALTVLRRHAEGRDAAARAVALHPQDAVIAMRHAAFLLALEDGPAAEREARRAIELDPAAEGAYLVLIDALRRQHRERDAISEARSALDGLAGGMNLALRLGRMLLDRKDPDGAAEAFARVTAMANAPRHAWIGHAEALEAAGRTAEAEAAARTGLAAQPEARELRALLGQLLLGRGEVEAARDALAEAIEEEAGSLAVSLAMADAWLRQGRRREALQLLHAAVAAAPGHAEAEIRLGQLLLDDGRHDEGAALFERVTAAAPDLPAAWIGLSDAERLRKRVKPALEAYRRAVAAGADAPAIRALRFRLFGEYDG